MTGDGALAQAVSTELRETLLTRGGQLSGPVYAVALWSDVDEASLGVSVATEASFAERCTSPVYRGVPRERLSVPSGLRWDSGDWEIVAESFVSAATQSRLDDLAAPVAEAVDRWVDGGADPRKMHALQSVYRPWQLTTNLALALTRPLEAVAQRASDAVSYVEFANHSTAVEAASSMMLTVDPHTMNRLFPQWKVVADGLSALAADPATLDAARAWAARMSESGSTGWEAEHAPLSAQLRRALGDCGYTPRQLAMWTGARVPNDFDNEVPNAGTSDTLPMAFVVADRISPPER